MAHQGGKSTHSTSAVLRTPKGGTHSHSTVAALRFTPIVPAQKGRQVMALLVHEPPATERQARNPVQGHLP